jgi:hypothetical protein
VREWTLILPSEFPLWELESWWTFESSEIDCRGKNPLDWKVPYIIGKFLELRCLKWVHMTIWVIKTQVMAKRRVGNRHNFLMFIWHATYHWKALDEGYNSISNLTSIGSLHTKLWAPIVMGIPKWHLSASLVAKHKVYYKGEGGGFPQV